MAGGAKRVDNLVQPYLTSRVLECRVAPDCVCPKSQMKKLITTLCVALLVAGCSGSYDLPAVDSGVVEIHSSGGVPDQPQTAKLSSTQIKALSDWFSSHRTGWKRTLEDTAPGVMVYLKHGDANVAYVNVQGHDVYSGGRRRLLTVEERKDIQGILSTGLRSEDRADPSFGSSSTR